MVRWRARTALPLAAIVVGVAAGCGDDDDGATLTTAGTIAVTETVPLAPATTAAPTTGPTATPVSAPSTVAASSSVAAPTTTVGPGLAGLATDAVTVREIGRSVEGRPITAVERGTPGGTRVVVIGVIHGDEDDGVAILERLATAPVPDGIDLWLVESMNPDGQAAQQRGNANGVDLNRNFPYDGVRSARPATASTPARHRRASPRRRRSWTSSPSSVRRSCCGTTRTCSGCRRARAWRAS